MNYWLIKQEPEDYPFAQLWRDKKTAWTGVRNYQARNNLRAMLKGDQAFYYHSGGERQIVGLCEIAKIAYPDPTATEGDWSCVDVRPLKSAATPLTLTAIKAEPSLSTLALVRQSRLSVMPVSPAEAIILRRLLGWK
jgi:predicted RNA-binding protein with PUA-like domain